VGTSTPYGGPGGRNPLIPNWLPSGDGETPPPAPSDGSGNGEGDGSAADGTGASPAPGPPAPRPPRPPAVPPPPSVPSGLSSARGNFTRFARSGGNDRSSFGRAVSGYVRNAAGGARQAAQRMGSSRAAGARLLNFLSDAQTRGTREALRALNLEQLAGRPIEEIFLGLADYICPEVGTVDEGISRDAFIETIADLAEQGIVDLDGLTSDQIQTVFELFATHAIEARLCNDIGSKLITLPANAAAAASIQAQLRDFIARGVSDALTAARAALDALTPSRALVFVDGVYQAAFEILQTMGEREAEA
jgi:hypothetical protein